MRVGAAWNDKRNSFVVGGARDVVHFCNDFRDDFWIVFSSGRRSSLGGSGGAGPPPGNLPHSGFTPPLFKINPHYLSH